MLLQIKQVERKKKNPMPQILTSLWLRKKVGCGGSATVFKIKGPISTTFNSSREDLKTKEN